MKVLKNISLKRYNTFGIDAKARFFCGINSIEALALALQQPKYPEILVLGGGSNMLITQDVAALVLYINIKGIHVEEEDDETVVIKAMAGENWHQMVLWSLDQGYGGLENLSLIPGNTGTAPIQNIGAYGVELKDVFVGCEAMEIGTRKIKKFTHDDCKFGYRDSFFKNEGLGKYIITAVCVRLTKKNHCTNTSYGAIETELAEKKIRNVTPRDISNAVIAIRQRKLPDPNKIGNSGSFFKNPIIDKVAFDGLSKEHPGFPFYKVSNNEYKIPAGWLIEQCGFKGKRFGDAGVHEHQALVLVNHGGATGKEILELAHKIMADVRQRFGISIVPEVNIIK